MRRQSCLNCNSEGHYERFCSEPVTSHGIILLRQNLQEVLLVQRKVSIGFFSFMRGKYSDDNLMKEYISEMTPFERNLLKSKTFDEIWDFLWESPHNNAAKEPVWLKNYINAKRKFLQVNVQQLLLDIPGLFDDTEYVFPKGKRNDQNETSLKCALREFTEETGIQNKNVCVLRVKPIVEVYLASNNIRYRSIYYIAILDAFTEVNMNFSSGEIKKICWFTFQMAFQTFRENVGQIAKKNSLKKLIHVLIRFYTNAPGRIVSVSLAISLLSMATFEVSKKANGGSEFCA